MHTHQFALDAASNRDDTHRRHRAQPAEIHIDVARARHAGGHRCGRAATAFAPLTAFAVFAALARALAVTFRVALAVTLGVSGFGAILSYCGRRVIGSLPLLVAPIAATAQRRHAHQTAQPFC